MASNVEDPVSALQAQLEKFERRTVEAEEELQSAREELKRLRALAIRDETNNMERDEADSDSKEDKVQLLLEEVGGLRALMLQRADEVNQANAKINALQEALDKATKAGPAPVKPSAIPNPLPSVGDKPHSVRQAVIPPEERARLAEDRLYGVLSVPGVDSTLKESNVEVHMTREQREEIREKIYGTDEPEARQVQYLDERIAAVEAREDKVKKMLTEIVELEGVMEERGRDVQTTKAKAAVLEAKLDETKRLTEETEDLVYSAATDNIHFGHHEKVHFLKMQLLAQKERALLG